MRIDLAGRRACVVGGPSPVGEAIAAALGANGATVARPPDGPTPDIVVVVRELQPDDRMDGEDAGDLQRLGEAMGREGSGRIVLVLSALAAVPSRRHPQASAAAAAAMVEVRTLAMRLGPGVLVNAVGCGMIADGSGAPLSGDASMLSHVPSGQPGALDDIVHAVLFLCDPMNSYMTGQMLTVDGGWSAGYGRNF